MCDVALMMTSPRIDRVVCGGRFRSNSVTKPTDMACNVANRDGWTKDFAEFAGQLSGHPTLWDLGVCGFAAPCTHGNRQRPSAAAAMSCRSVTMTFLVADTASRPSVAANSRCSTEVPAAALNVMVRVVPPSAGDRSKTVV